MEGIRSIAEALCVTIVITAILFLLLPGAHYQKIMRFAVSLFFLCGLVAPFADGTGALSFTLPEITVENHREETEAAMDDYLCGMVETRIAATLKDGLTAQAISFSWMETDVHIESDGSIYLDRIRIYGVLESETEAVRSYIYAQTGVIPDITA